MQEFRDRARAILDATAGEVGSDPDLEYLLQEAFEELDGDRRSTTGAQSAEKRLN